MATELIINASLPETRISLMESGEIQELLIERASGKGIVGNIYKGKVTRVLPGMQAAFVDIGLEKAAFLYVDDVYVHSEDFEDEAPSRGPSPLDIGEGSSSPEDAQATEGSPGGITPNETTGDAPAEQEAGVADEEDSFDEEIEGDDSDPEMDESDFSEDDDSEDSEHDDEAESEDEEGEDDDESAEDDEPVGMGSQGGGDDENTGNPPAPPEGTIAPPVNEGSPEGSSDQDSGPGDISAAGGEGQDGGATGGRRRHRRGRRGGRFRRKGKNEPQGTGTAETVESNEGVQVGAEADEMETPTPIEGSASHLEDTQDHRQSDRTAIEERGMEGGGSGAPGFEDSNRPTIIVGAGDGPRRRASSREEFKEPRSRDKRVRSKQSLRQPKPQVNIQDILKEGQEVLVQVAKDPISTKGARLTCHISLPGRHLVCMPTIDHVGVSRRIDRDDERRKLRDIVERNRPKNLGFIVRTASGRGQAEKRIKQDIDYLTNLWTEIREKSAQVVAPALVYEDLNAVLRAIRDWVTEDIDRIIVDSRYHFNDIQRFASHFMPSLKPKIELYHGDIPIFDAYSISTELSRALERKVWLKSGGYIVVDQAEALVAIDVNTGRYVGKKNLEDTILKTNLEAVQEIAYQLRLRNCGGIIILDFIDMEKEENKQRVYRALDEALKKDRARPTILKISELGLVEMTRKRTRDTIVRALCEPCVHCEGKGFIKSKQTVGYEVLREIERSGIVREVNKILVQAHPDVIDILAIDERETLDSLERRYRKQIYLQAIGDFHQEQFEVTGDQPEGAQRVQIRPRGSSSQPEDRSAHRSGGKERESKERDRGGRNKDREKGWDRGRQQRVPQPLSNGGIPQIIPVVREPSIIVDTEGQGPIVRVPLNEGTQGPAVEGGPAIVIPVQSVPRGPDDEFFTEEDRLAFQRAQAAQDAALAKMRGAAAQVGATPGGRPPKGDAGGGRGAVGGRGRRGGRRGKFRGPAPRVGAGPRFDNRGGSGGAQGGGGDAGGGAQGGGSDTGGGDTGGDPGSGGDRSNPPA